MGHGTPCSKRGLGKNVPALSARAISIAVYATGFEPARNFSTGAIARASGEKRDGAEWRSRDLRSSRLVAGAANV